MCRRQGTARFLPVLQAATHCALPGFDQRAWTGERLATLPPVYMGAPSRYDLEGQTNDWYRPNEDIENEGCPGAWYRSPFVASVLRYTRRPDGNGGRVPNRLLDRCDDELVIEAVETLEAHEDAWRQEYLRSLRPEKE